ncbi:hypothetical protein OSB04_026551 [Centaurea solstitialis]|uniref:DUF674 domain-containing protein n=1 Tax=Centaurea solstitialis TaxID=347529 RepID=A0AA38SC32_9ASTR|nr:hypothetical protein OSB04_026551 [Centaurea solstitialis]
MTTKSASSDISLKLLINKKTHKVLFAEANKEFVDFLFQIPSLPLGTVTRLLKKHSMLGSLGTLYASIENLSDAYMQPNQTKDSILNPKVANYGAHVPLLLPNDDDVPMTKKNLYTCGGGCGYHNYVTDDPTATCPSCYYRMNRGLSYVTGSVATKSTTKGGGFVKGVVTYMIMDDLEVMPMSTISGITMLKKFHVTEIGDLEEKVVSFGMKEGLMLLKAFFESKNVLTTVFMT